MPPRTSSRLPRARLTNGLRIERTLPAEAVPFWHFLALGPVDPMALRGRMAAKRVEATSWAVLRGQSLGEILVGRRNRLESRPAEGLSPGGWA